MNDSAHQVENTIRDAIESGEDIYEKVREITLKALTERELDRDNIKEVVQAVGKGIAAGMDTQYASARKILQQSSEALDDALASTAQATKLAVEEASSRVNDFSQHDLKKTLDDLQGLEELFLETVADIARQSRGVVGEVMEDLLNHARTKGTAVGKEAENVIHSLTDNVISSEHSAFSAAKETAYTLAKIGSGFLAGIAESIHGETQKK